MLSEYQDGVITTISGRRVNLLAPDPQEIDLHDIAHALARECRYGNHIRLHYSVAEHSIHLSHLVGSNPLLRLWALLHDASEAYTGDLVSPLKALPGFNTFRVIEAALMEAVCLKFGVPGKKPPVVHMLDKTIRDWEIYHLRGELKTAPHAMDSRLGRPICMGPRSAGVSWVRETLRALDYFEASQPAQVLKEATVVCEPGD